MTCADIVDDRSARASGGGGTIGDALPWDDDEPLGDGAPGDASVAGLSGASGLPRHTPEDESLGDDAPGGRVSSDAAEGAAPGDAVAAAAGFSHRTIARDGLNVRSGPGVEFGVVQSLPLGTSVRVLKRDGSWALIARADDGADGYVYASFLETLGTVGDKVPPGAAPEPIAVVRPHRGADTSARYPGGEWMGQTTNNSGRFKSGMPKFLVMHYTAGGAGRGSAEYLFRPHDKPSSAHFVVDRDGAVYQISGIDRVTWHAGESFWRGVSNLNTCSIGVEFANYGYLRRTQDRARWLIGATDYRSVYKDRPDIFTDDVVVARHKNGGPELGWEPYAPAQIRSGLELATWILRQHPTIREIIGHDDIAPTRKSDPGPAFPMRAFANLLHPNSEGGDLPEAGIVNVSAAPPSGVSRYVVNVTALNCRGGPGTGFETLSWGPLAEGETVDLLQEAGDWCFIESRKAAAARRGWVFGQYLTPA